MDFEEDDLKDNAYEFKTDFERIKPGKSGILVEKLVNQSKSAEVSLKPQQNLIPEKPMGPRARRFSYRQIFDSRQ